MNFIRNGKKKIFLITHEVA